MGALDAAVREGSRLGKLAAGGERALVLIVGAELRQNVKPLLRQWLQLCFAFAPVTLCVKAQKTGENHWIVAVKANSLVKINVLNQVLGKFRNSTASSDSAKLPELGIDFLEAPYVVPDCPVHFSVTFALGRLDKSHFHFSRAIEETQGQWMSVTKKNYRVFF